MSSNLVRWGGLAAMAVVLVAALWLANGVAARLGGWAPHATSHLTAAVVGAALTVSAIVVRRLHASHFSRWAGRVGPSVFIAGLAWFTASQLVETLSAVIEYPNAGLLHTASGLATMFGALVATTSLVLTAFVGIRRGGNVSSRIPLAPFLVLGASNLFVFMMVGFSPLAVVATVILCAVLAVSAVVFRRRKGRLWLHALRAKR